MLKFTTQLTGKRLVLQATIPLATQIFTVLGPNRAHLMPWFSWAKTNKRIEDSLKYLLSVEAGCRAGTAIDYGLYLNN